MVHPSEDGSSLDDDVAEWFSNLGHGLGHFARSVVDTFRGTPEARPRPAQVEPPEPPEQLLARLRQHLQHERDYEAMAEDLELERLLWRALRALRQLRVRKRLRGRRATPREAAVEAEDAPQPATPQPAAALQASAQQEAPDQDSDLLDGMLEEHDPSSDETKDETGGEKQDAAG